MSGQGNSEFVDYYELFGITPDADSKQIRAAFLKKAQEHHPDVGGAAEAMEQLNVAYATLKSATGKAAYDTIHSLRVGGAKTPDYKYDGGRHAKDVDDMSDAEIDEFLDTMLAEFRHGVPDTKKATVKQRIKRMFEI